MLILRLIGVLLIISVSGCFLMFVLTRDQRYLRYAWSLLKYAVIAALLILALFALERVIIL